jgi:flagellar biosynthetic protein FliQ
MEAGALIDISREAIFVMIKVSLPILLVALIVGIIISLFQALTQIQENTLSFVPKLVAVFLCLILFMPYMVSTLKTFSDHINEKIISLE